VDLKSARENALVWRSTGMYGTIPDISSYFLRDSTEQPVPHTTALSSNGLRTRTEYQRLRFAEYVS
ncbi:MAG: hypothetical protein IJP97_00390, partial [Synergistaceae bacterium]|nr:hypothetical protein [Synergistaceae bacterium]